MKLFRKLNTFGSLPFATKLLLVEALFTSAWVKLSLKLFPFKRVMKWLGSDSLESSMSANPDTQPIRKQVKTVLNLCNKYAPWPTECYTLSITGKLLLKRRNINSTLYIGFHKAADDRYKGHAWLRANDTYISGFSETFNFTVHSVFS